MDPKPDPTRADPMTRDGGELVAHAERLAVTTTIADGRRVRLRKRVVTEEKQVTVTVRREELVVEHLDASGQVVGAGAPLAGGQVRPGTSPAAELVLHAEDFEIVKRTVPVERVRVFVDRITTDRQVTDTVAREELVVEGDTDHRPFTRDPRADGSVGAPL